MDCRVIGISRPRRGRRKVAHLVAEKLGFRLVDDEIIARPPRRPASRPNHGKVERSPSLIERILKYMGTAPVESGFGAYVPPTVGASESYEGIITSVIREVAAAGNVVILAHGASIPLAGTPGLLRVLVTGSTAARAARMASQGTDSGKAVSRSKSPIRSAAIISSAFYDVRQESPSHYDLIVNTDTITPASAAALIAAAARG
jgi:hypothetical protein